MSEITDSSKKRQQLEQAGTLHWLHWLIVVLSLLLTFFAWYFSQQQVNDKIQAQFDREAEQTIELVLERLQQYEDALWGGVAMLQSSGGDTDFISWRAYVEKLHLLQKYPGINGLGVIHKIDSKQLPSYILKQQRQQPNFHVHPAHREKMNLPITYVVPVKENKKAVGLDMAYEKNRYTSALKARDTGQAQITAPITLVQDRAKTPGFLFYAPFYTGTDVTLQERQLHFRELVYAPFIVNKLMDGVLSQTKRHVAIKIVDDENVLYDELVSSNAYFDSNSNFKTIKKETVYGRTWTFTLQSDQSFQKATSNQQPLTILFGGIVIDTLLLLLFISISRASKRALHYADEMTYELRKKKRALESSNKELNQFAYIASHDLRAPLRNIKNVSSWIIEDDKDNLSRETQTRLDTIQECIGHMDELINGVLAYSRIGNVHEDVVDVDLNQCIRKIMSCLDVEDRVNLQIPESLPTVSANATIISQIFSNLISNAIKHSDKETIEISIKFGEKDGYYEFSVSDNGPGIEPQFCSKIFELFQSLKPKSEADNSGIGLALIKKAVEAQEGRIWVDSELGKGCTFTLTWKKK